MPERQHSFCFSWHCNLSATGRRLAIDQVLEIKDPNYLRLIGDRSVMVQWYDWEAASRKPLQLVGDQNQLWLVFCACSKYLWWLIMIDDLAATFLKLCHVLCNFSAVVIFEVAAWLQALLDWGLYIKDGPWKDYSTSLHFWRKYFAISGKVYIFDIFQCLVLQMHFCDVIGPKCYLIKCSS